MPNGTDQDQQSSRAGAWSAAAIPEDSFLARMLGLRGLGLIPPVVLLSLWLVGGTVGYMVIEGWSLFDALYMTVITLSTVGFAEVRELTQLGRAFTAALIVAGLGTVFYAFTAIGQLVVEGEIADALGRRRMQQSLKTLEDHYIICGYGRTSAPIVEGFEEEGEPFCVIDQDPAVEADLRADGVVYVIGDATEEETLEKAGLDRAKALLTLLPSDADNLYVTMSAKNINPDIRILARATDDKAELNLRRGGADVVASPYKTAGMRILHAALKPTVVEFMELATPRAHLELSLEEVIVATDSELDGSSLSEAEIRRRCGVIIVAIKRPNGEMAFNPHPSETLVPGDTLVAMGEEEDLERLEALAKSP